VRDRAIDSGAARLSAPVEGVRTIDLGTFVQQNLGPIAIAVSVAAVALAIGLLWQARQTARLSRRLDALTRGGGGGSLEAVLGQHLERVRAVVRDLDRLENRTSAVETDLRSALGRVGFVRFNPFEDTGGNQSFALAILDAAGTGFVVSSLHARSGTRVYAKAIEAGRSDMALSSEEEDAVRRALGVAVAAKA
jgi:hypothetical protein